MITLTIYDVLYMIYAWEAYSITIALGLLTMSLWWPTYDQSISLTTMLTWMIMRFGSGAYFEKV